jgi:chromosomal replication initiator protein DnaA
MVSRPTSKLGEFLLERKLVNKKQLHQALKRQQERGTSLGSILIEMGVLSGEALGTFLEQECQVPHVDLPGATPSVDALRRLDRDLALSLIALPLALDGQKLTVVMSDPLDTAAVEQLRDATGCEIDPVFGSPEDIRGALERWYASAGGESHTASDKVPPTLESFRVGPENEGAYEAALEIARLAQGAPSPLLLVGREGSGKSHLLHGIHSKLASQLPAGRVVLLSCTVPADETLRQLQQAAEGINHLLVDDVDELVRQEELERSLLEAVNSVFSRKGNVVVTSKKRPQELRGLNPGLKLSLGLGVVIEVSPPSFPQKPQAPPAVHPKEEPVAAVPTEGLRDEADAILQEGRMALDDVRGLVVGGGLEAELEEAELIWQEAKVAFEGGEYDRAEQLGMEALEKAALLQKRAQESPTPVAADTQEQARASDRINAVRKLLLHAAKSGAEEYATKEMKSAAALVEEAASALQVEEELSTAMEKLERAAQTAEVAEKKAITLREKDRVRQEEERRRRAQHAVAKLEETVKGLAGGDLGVRLETHIEDLKAIIQSATSYLEADNYGQALELALDGRRMADEVLEKIGQRRTLRRVVRQVDKVLRSAELRTSNDPWIAQQLVEIQNALSEAERVLLGDSEDYALGLNWARVAEQKVAKLVGRELQEEGEREAVEQKRPGKLRLRKRFTGFATGECNRFAYSVARAAAENPQSIRSPLYIYGEIGTGKSHLLSAIVAAIDESSNEKAVVFVTADDFANEFRAAEEKAALEAFRSRYRTPDLLLVDDIQFLVEHEREAREFLHALGAIERTGGLVVLTADRPPREMAGLSSGLRSRLEGGVIARLRSPDLETRKLIIRMEARKEAVELTEEVITLLANLVDTNPRDLLGAYGKAVAYSKVTERPIDSELIEEALREVLSTGRRYAVGRK